MKDGICPKCGAEEVYMSEAGGRYEVIRLDNSTGGAAMIYDFVCTVCGHVEQYILSKNALKLIRLNPYWKHVRAEKRKNDDTASEDKS